MLRLREVTSEESVFVRPREVDPPKPSVLLRIPISTILGTLSVGLKRSDGTDARDDADRLSARSDVHVVYVVDDRARIQFA